MNWIKSSACESATCVEVSIQLDSVAVRNSACPADVLWFTHQEWSAFLQGASHGDFDFWTKGEE